jgi:hypothetical protein
VNQLKSYSAGKAAIDGPIRHKSVAAEAAGDDPAPPKMPAFDYKPKAYMGPKLEEVLEKRKKFLNPAMFLYYKKPV